MPDVICTTVATDGPPAKRRQSSFPLPPKRAFSSSLIQNSSCSPLRSDSTTLSLLPSSRQVYSHHTQVHEDNKNDGIRTHNTKTTTSTTTSTTRNESKAPNVNYDRSFSLDDTSQAAVKNGENPATWIIQPTDTCWYNPELKPPHKDQQNVEDNNGAICWTNSKLNTHQMVDHTAAIKDKTKGTNKSISFKSLWNDSVPTSSVCRKLVHSIHQGGTFEKNPSRSTQPQLDDNNCNHYGVPSNNDSAILIQPQDKTKSKQAQQSKKKGLTAFFEWLIGGPIYATNPADRVYDSSNRQNSEIANFQTEEDSDRPKPPGIYIQQYTIITKSSSKY